MILWIALGGGIGAILRYVTVLTFEKYQSPFYIATFIVNIIGSLIMGFMIIYNIQSQIVFAFITLGILGGYTTFSTFAFDFVRLAQQKKYITAIVYTGSTLIVSFIFFLIGLYLGGRII